MRSIRLVVLVPLASLALFAACAGEDAGSVPAVPVPLPPAHPSPDPPPAIPPIITRDDAGLVEAGIPDAGAVDADPGTPTDRPAT